MRVAFLSTPEELEFADLLLRKAASDLSAARALAADSDQRDGVVGFHAQQAVEKSLKAVLAVRGLEIPRTHDIDLLTRLVAAKPAELPKALADGKSLSPWAVAMRYDEMEATLDRGSALTIAEASLGWARSIVMLHVRNQRHDGYPRVPGSEMLAAPRVILPVMSGQSRASDDSDRRRFIADPEVLAALAVSVEYLRDPDVRASMILRASRVRACV